MEASIVDVEDVEDVELPFKFTLHKVLWFLVLP